MSKFSLNRCKSVIQEEKHYPDIMLVEKIGHMYPDSSFQRNIAYFVNTDSKKIYKLKKTITHTKAIILDATRGSKKFGVKRSEALPIIKDMGHDSLLDYLQNGKNHFSKEILQLASENNWVRITIGNDSTVYGQAKDFKSVSIAFQEIFKKWPTTSGYVENFDDKTYHLVNQKEIEYFIKTGKYRRMKMSDFR